MASELCQTIKDIITCKLKDYTTFECFLFIYKWK